MKTLKLAVLMDPIETIHPKKDTTFAILLEAQRRQWEIFYFTSADLFLDQQAIFCQAVTLKLKDSETDYFFISSPPACYDLREFDIVFMRKDPPIDSQFLYTTYLLDRAKQMGVFIVNDPSHIRDDNEKLFATTFPQCCPETLVSARYDKLIAFLKKHSTIVLKPLGQRGGHGVFRFTENDLNLYSALELLTNNQTQPIMAQKYIPSVMTEGDKRLLVIDGEPYPYALVRSPKPGDFRGNISAGAITAGQPINDRDSWIAKQVGPTLKSHGLYFVGLDIIGGYLTEINITSPTGVREIDAAFGVNVSEHLLNILLKKLSTDPGDKSCARSVDKDI